MVDAAFILWLPITLILFRLLPTTAAAAASIVGAPLLLPAVYAWNPPGLPPLDRDAISVLSVGIAVMFFRANRLSSSRGGRYIEVIVVLMILASALTVTGNGDRLVIGGKFLPGMPTSSIVSRVSQALLMFFLPMYLGRALVRNPKELREVLKVLAVTGIAYSVLVLWEARMSPRLHTIVYGYLPASFDQQRRGGLLGWRPMVFIGHGLALAQFMTISLISIVALWRQGYRIKRQKIGPVAAYAYTVLLMCSSMGATIFATIAMPFLSALREGSRRWLFKANLALLAALIALTFAYPAVRAAGLFPTQTLVWAASTVSDERARSLNFRFVNEDQLLTRALKRPFFGWGGYGRERLYDERGRNATVSDGYWVIIMGQGGLAAFLCHFSLLLLPAIAALSQLRRRRINRDAITVLAATWILVLCVVDLIPNGFFSARTTFLGGAMAGALAGWKRRPVRRAKPRRPRDGSGPEPRLAAPEPVPSFDPSDAGLSRGLRR